MNKKGLIAVLLFVISLSFTGGVMAQPDDPTPLEKIEQTPDQILLDTAEDREGTVRIINNKFQQKRFNPGATNKYRFTVDNQSEQQIDIQLNAQVQTPLSDIPIQITTPNNGTFQEKTLQPSEQESYIVEFQAIQTEINTPREVLFTLSENNTNTQTVHNLALTTESGTSSTQTIEPTGERQQLATTVDRFNDSTETERANKSSGIPPIAPDGNDNSIGQIYNFERLLDTNTQNSTKLYPQTDQLNVGFEFGNIPSNNYYTLQTRHLINHTSDIPTYAEVRLVGATGEEIDKNTTYYIGSQHSNTTSFNTQYIQLSEEEADYVRNNGRLYTVFHHPEEKQDNTGEYIPRDSRSPIDLQTGTSGTQYNGTQIDLQVFDLLSSQNPLTYTNSQLNTKDITLKTSDGTILSSPGEFDRGDQIRVEFTVENTGSSVISNQQVYLLENQQSVKNKSITLNPGEEGTITFYLNKFISGEYTYTTPELDDTVTAVVDTEASTTPADAEITPISGIQEINNRYIVEKTGTTAELTASDTISDSPIQSYQWTLEDETMTETQTGETFSYSFAQKGQYSLELAVETEETTSYTNVTLNVATLPPEAEVGDDIVVSPGEEIRFNGTGSSHPLESGTIDTYRWDFGDGNSREGSSVKYSYSEEGTYEAQLTVVDGNGNNDIATRTITVEGQKPVAKFTTSPDEPVAEIDDVVFNASESFDPTGQGITQYQWDFGDGETKSREIPSVEHTYSEPGEYEVRLTVSNLTRTETITKTVTIQDKPFDATITGNKEVSWGTLASYNMYDSPDPDELIETVEWTLYEGQGEDRTQIQTFEKREFTYEFEELGDYSLDLYVEGGRFEDSESIDITVNTGPPRAVTVEEEDEIFISQTINFQGQDSYHPLSQVDIANYRWWYDRDGETQVISDGGGRGNANAVDYQFDVPTQNYTAEDPRTPDPVSLRDPYDVQLEVTDSNDGTDSEDVEVEVVNRGPVIDLPFDPPIKVWYSDPLKFEGEFIKHPDSPPVEIESIEWEIVHPNNGVEETVSGRSIDYLFEDITEDIPNENYTVNIKVVDEFGAKATTSFGVNVEARDPEAGFSYNPSVPSKETDIDLDGSSSLHNSDRAFITDYNWTVEKDGSVVSNISESDSVLKDYEFAQDGAHTVSLEVVDNLGQSHEVTKVVTVDTLNSCAKIDNEYPDNGSGVYSIFSNGELLTVYCDLEKSENVNDGTPDGSGWTLLLKTDGTDSEFAYDGKVWTDQDYTLNENSLNLDYDTPAKYEAFNKHKVERFKAVFPNEGHSYSQDHVMSENVRDIYGKEKVPYEVFSIEKKLGSEHRGGRANIDANNGCTSSDSGVGDYGDIWLDENTDESIFNYQCGNQLYGFNVDTFTDDPRLLDGTSNLRWGWHWNNEQYSWETQDVITGLGLETGVDRTTTTGSITGNRTEAGANFADPDRPTPALVWGKDVQATGRSCISIDNDTRGDPPSGPGYSFDFNDNGTETDVYCDMTPEDNTGNDGDPKGRSGGPVSEAYTFKYIEDGIPTTRVSDKNSCRKHGMILFQPRGPDEYDVGRNYVIDEYGKSAGSNWDSGLGPLGIYYPLDGDSNFNDAYPGASKSFDEEVYRILKSEHYGEDTLGKDNLYSGGTDGWQTMVSDKFWATGASVEASEPNGDFSAYSWLGLYGHPGECCTSYPTNQGYITNYNDLPNYTYTYDSYLCTTPDSHGTTKQNIKDKFDFDLHFGEGE